MKTRTVAATMLVMLTALGLTGCAMFNKGRVQYTRTTTLGQELIDLKTAKEKDAITEEEYSKAKQTLLNMVSADVHISCKTEKED
jgi:hypothetical protein